MTFLLVTQKFTTNTNWPQAKDWFVTMCSITVLHLSIAISKGESYSEAGIEIAFLAIKS